MNGILLGNRLESHYKYYKKFLNDIIDCSDPCILEKLKNANNSSDSFEKPDNYGEKDYMLYDK